MRAGLGRTALVFVLLLGLFNAAYLLEKQHLGGRYVDFPYTALVTAASAAVGQWFMPIPVERRGEITLGSGNAAVVVRGGCNGIEAVFLLLAGVLAVPAPWRRKGAALVAYVPLLFGANLGRVLLLLYIMAEYPEYIDFFHYQVGQGMLVVLVLVLWAHHLQRCSAAAARAEA